jgi:hypothetical protein
MNAQTKIEIVEINDVFTGDNVSTDYVYTTSKKDAKASLMSSLKSGNVKFGFVRDIYIDHVKNGFYTNVEFDHNDDGIEVNWNETNNADEKVYVMKVVTVIK